MDKILIALVMVFPITVGATTVEEHTKRMDAADDTYLGYLRGLAVGAQHANLVSMTENNRYLFCLPKNWDGDGVNADLYVAGVIDANVKAGYLKGYPVEYIFMHALRDMYPCDSYKVFPNGK